MEIYIGICDLDPVYSRRLASGLLRKAETKIRMVEFTTYENITKFIEKKSLEILLVARNEYMDGLNSERIRNIVCLYEEKPSEDERLWAETHKVEVLYKYQPLSVLYREVMSAYHRHGGIIRDVALGDKKLIAVYSPVHRCGKTLFSLALAEQLGLKKPTLYINLEEHSVLLKFFGDSAHGDVIDAMYYFLQGELESQEKHLISSMDSFDYILAAHSARDIRDLKNNEIAGLLEHFHRKSIYTYVVVDVGNAVSDVYCLLSCFDQIYMPLLSDIVSEQKKDLFYDEVSSLGIGIADKISPVAVPYMEWEQVFNEGGIQFDEKIVAYVNGVIGNAKE